MNAPIDNKKWLVGGLLAVALALALLAGIVADRTLLAPAAPKPEAAKTEAAKLPAGAPAAQKAVKAPLTKVQAPPEGFDPAIVQVGMPEAKKVAVEIGIPGKMAFNAERLKIASARLPGRVERILAFEGTSVKAGQPLAELYSPEFISAQNEYLLAAQTLRTFQRGASADLLEDAKATQESAANRLRVLGVVQEDIDKLTAQGRPSPNLIIRAPIGGLVAKRNVDPGAYLNIGDALMSIVDPGSLWFIGNVFEQDIAKLARGQKLVLRTEALPGEVFEGTVSFIAPVIDPATHTLAVRCDVSSTRLRPEMFVNAKLAVGQRDALIVPKSAVVKIRGVDYLVLERPNKVYERVLVQGADRGDGTYAVYDGLTAAARVVTTGATLIGELISKQEG
ncbi:MAG: efflux RND transporter periplasmic adaptor subunit [Candidatus Protistobacter heckmanni]|nr:efflux RND transporter periplasmic adaptor subunit [Candidatus Protistobacter heckmanni]